MTDIHSLDPDEEFEIPKREVDGLVFGCMSAIAVATAVVTKRWPKWGYRVMVMLGVSKLLLLSVNEGESQ